MKKKYLSFGFSILCTLVLVVVASILFTANVRNSEVAVFVPKGTTHEQLLDSLRKYGVPFELHIYEKGGHGGALAQGHPWAAEALRWIDTLD